MCVTFFVGGGLGFHVACIFSYFIFMNFIPLVKTLNASISVRTGVFVVIKHFNTQPVVTVFYGVDAFKV